MSYPALTVDDIETLTLFFDWVDQDKDGYITVSEIKSACEVDVNADGIISEDERLQCAQPWLEGLAGQDLDDDSRLTLDELLQFNNNAKQQA